MKTGKNYSGMVGKMAVIKDVARLAGVSTGTVSKYLNNPQNLKEKTRMRVEQAIQELQYKPSPLARSMRTGKTNTLAVMVPDVTNPFFAEVYNSIRMSAAQSGYTPILYTTEDNLDTLKDYLAGISLRQADGLILCFLDEDEAIDRFINEIQAHIPIVLLSWDINSARFNSVVIDVFEGICKSTRYMISRGHKDIAYIGGPEDSRISREKHDGYIKAMKEAGLEIKPEYIFHGSYNLQSGYQAARKFTMLSETPSALVAANDILAIGCIKYLLQKKIKIPEEVAVIGFDNISLSAMYEPALSTISLPIEQMGKEAIKLLLSRISKPISKNKQVILKTGLVVRNSTDKNVPTEFEW